MKFVKSFHHKRSPSVNVYFKSVFDKCDEDQDGYISLREFQNFIKKHNLEIPKNVDMDSMIQKAYMNSDLNHDNKLDFEEFVRLLKSSKFNEDFKNLGDRYIKFIVVPPNRKTLVLQRTVTNTGRYEDERQCKPSAVSILILSLLQLILFYVDENTAVSNRIFIALRFCPGRKSEIWRFLSFMFVHNDQSHLFFNLVTQLAFGIPLEMVHTWRVPVLYCAGVIGGVLFQAVIYPNDDLIGASPGVFAVLTAHISTVILNWREMTHPLAHLFIYGLYVSFDAIYSYVRYGNMDSVSYASHFGGSVCGLLVGIQILRNLRETQLEKIIWWFSMMAYILLMGGLFICLFIVKPDNPYC